MKIWKTFTAPGKRVSLSETTRRLIQEKIKDDDLVLDIAGAKCVFNRADYAIDIAGYEERSQNKAWGPKKEYFTRDTWIKSDIHEPFPFEDNFFDFSLCTHTLEDIKDPISVCKEIMRVSKSGYIECPTREVESTYSLVKDGLIGYGNHRWFVEMTDNSAVFTSKTPYMYCVQGLSLAPGGIATNTYVGLFWNDSFDVSENIIIGTNETIEDQRSFIEKIVKGKYYQKAEELNNVNLGSY